MRLLGTGNGAGSAYEAGFPVDMRLVLHMNQP